MKLPFTSDSRRIHVLGAIVLAIGVSAMLVRLPVHIGLTTDVVAVTPAGNLAIRAVGAPERLKDYLVRRDSTTGPFNSDRRSAQRGRVITFNVTNLFTSSPETCRVQWSQLHAGQEEPANQRAWRQLNVLGWPDGLVILDPAAGSFAGDVWVPIPNPAEDVGSFYIRLQLVCANAVIDQRDTESFPADLSTEAAAA